MLSRRTDMTDGFSCEASPVVSVIMSIFNEPTRMLAESINSILNQSFSDFEFIIVVDNPLRINDDILMIAKHDSRVIVVNNDRNIGLTKSLNKALTMARGRYIARMDADDISERTRLEEQVRFLENHPETTCLGSYVYAFIDKTDDFVFSDPEPFSDQEANRVRFLFCNTGLSHPSVMIRSSFLKDHEIGYDESMAKAQDYRLWYDILEAKGSIEVIPKILLRYRIHEGQITTAASSDQEAYANSLILEQLNKLGIEPTEKTLRCHKDLFWLHERRSVTEYDKHIDLLFDSNRDTLVYNQRVFETTVLSIWLRSILRAALLHREVGYLRTRYLSKCLSPRVIQSLRKMLSVQLQYRKQISKFRNCVRKTESQ